MGQMVVNGIALFLIIVLGYLLKRFGLLGKADGTSLSVIILNLTLPAVIIVNLADLPIEGYYLWLIPIAIVLTLLQIFLGKYFSRKESKEIQAFFMYGVSGYNVGNFILPFLQSFFVAGIPAISLFDVGNSIMLAGGTTIAVDHLSGKAEKTSFGQILKRLFRNPAFTTYLVMLTLRLLNISLPQTLVTMISPIAASNGFLSMLMIGLYLELRLPRKAMGVVGRSLLLRYGIGLVMVTVLYFLPLPSLMKVVLALAAVSPMPIFNTINAVLAGATEETVGFFSSMSFLLSLPLMMAVVLVFGI
ncbi:AEC family transporter [Enterococcus asini]|uniref:AEC family transporter n=1 Tax=Enterococcus asini TaxID=57732 RepID=UPI0026DD959E|nr:AEC family transporter [Enterococcus asini]